MTTWAERFVETKNGQRFHVLEQGEGPLVLLLHGFPDLAYSWRHQLPALAEAGFRAIAPDQRGYGKTGGPTEAAKYTTLHLVGDAVALLDALDAPTAVVVGHDLGAGVAWNCAQLRPDRFRGVAALAMAFHARRSVPPTQAIRRAVGDGYMYMLHFQEPGVAEQEFAAVGLRASLRRGLYGSSGDAPRHQRWRPIGPAGMPFFEGTVNPETLPSWVTEDDVEVYVREFERTGLTGALNWYRAMDASWEHMAAFAGARVMPPAIYIYGEEDPSMVIQSEALGHLPSNVPNLRECVALPGVGHWVHQERPTEVNAALLRFLTDL